MNTVDFPESRIIYKYRPLYSTSPENKDETTGFHRHTISLLTKGELYFADPFEFNDPFDTQFEIDMDIYDMKTFKTAVCLHTNKILLDFWLRYYDGWENWLAYYRNGYIKKGFVQKNENVYKHMFRICSLTKVCDHILMWSHYGAQHTGICIGIKVEKYENVDCLHCNPSQDFFKTCTIFKDGYIPVHDVVYRDERLPRYRYHYDHPDELNKFLLTKSTNWQYEQEVRACGRADYGVTYKTQKKTVELCEKQIAEIIFGARVDVEDIEKIKRILRNQSQIKYFKMKQNPDRYALDRIPF